MTKKTKKTEQPAMPDVKPNPALALALEATGFSTLHDALESVMEKLKDNKPEKGEGESDAD